MKANQHIRRFYIKLPNNASTEDIIKVINATKSDSVIAPVSQKTYEIRRKQARPFFRMFMVPSNSSKDKSKEGIFGKNMFRLFQG